MAAKIDRTGEEKTNNFGSVMIITRYKNSRSMDVYFPEYNWTKYNSDYKEFNTGNIKCPYEPRSWGYGYIGEGKYSSSNNKKAYTKWNNMLRRCYDEKFQQKEPSYIGCTVCDEWCNFQIFAQWFEENYYEIDNIKNMALDKDILVKNNKIYSPDTCIFVPQNINSLFINNKRNRGELPLGVRILPSGNYQAYCSNGYKKWTTIGTYHTQEEAFQSYKQYKESVIRKIANEYIGLIPQKLYNAMCKYEIEYDD